MGQRRKGTVCAGVGITTDHRHARQRGPLLGADDVHDALTTVGNVEIGHAVAAGILAQGLDLQARHRVGNAVLAAGGGHVVVDHRQIGIEPPRLPVRLLQPLEGLRAGHLVQQVAVDVEQAAAIGLVADDVCIPELVVECAGNRFHFPIMPCRSINLANGEWT